MPLPKPAECTGCILADKGHGFSEPSGTGSLGVMLLGEALGDHEYRQGRGFVEWAPAGSVLERVIRACGYDRSQFTIWNTVACRPPKDWLEGAPWEAGAIEHCRVHFARVMADRKPKVILALGNVATRATTGESGHKRGVGYLRGYVFPCLHYPGVLVIPTYHPSFIRRGESSMYSVIANDLRRAVDLAKNGYIREQITYTMPKKVELDDEHIPF